MRERSLHIILIDGNEGYLLPTKEDHAENNISVDMSTVNKNKVTEDFLHQRPTYEKGASSDLLFLKLNLSRIHNGYEVLGNTKTNSLSKALPGIELPNYCLIVDIDLENSNTENSYNTKPMNLCAFLEVKGIELILDENSFPGLSVT